MSEKYGTWSTERNCRIIQHLLRKSGVIPNKKGFLVEPIQSQFSLIIFHHNEQKQATESTGLSQLD